MNPQDSNNSGRAKRKREDDPGDPRGTPRNRGNFGSRGDSRGRRSSSHRGRAGRGGASAHQYSGISFGVSKESKTPFFGNNSTNAPTQAPVAAPESYLAMMGNVVPTCLNTQSDTETQPDTSHAQAAGSSSGVFAQARKNFENLGSSGNMTVGRVYHQQDSRTNIKGKGKAFEMPQRQISLAELLKPLDAENCIEIEGAAVLQQVEELCENFYDGTPKGRDHPTGFAIGKANQVKECTVFVKYNLYDAFEQPRFLSLGTFRCKYILESQNPGLHFNHNSGQNKRPTHIYRGHMTRMRDGDSYHIFRKAEIGVLDFTETALRSILSSIGVDSVPQDITDDIIAEANAWQPQFRSAVVYMVTLTSRVSFHKLSTGHLGDELNKISDRAPIMLCWIVQTNRFNMGTCKFMNPMWEKLMTANSNGVFQHYSAQMAAKKAGLPGPSKDYVTYVKSLDQMLLAPAPHLFYRSKEAADDMGFDAGERKDALDIKLCDLPVKTFFSSREEAFHIMSLGILREHQYNYRVLNVLFGAGRIHRGTVESVTANVVLMRFTLTVTDGQDIMPISPGTKFNLRLISQQAAEDSVAKSTMDSGFIDTNDSAIDDLINFVNIGKTSTDAELPSWKAQVIDSPSDRELRMFLQLKESEEANGIFKPNSTLSFELHIQANDLSSTRQLMAVRLMTTTTKANTREHNIQNAVLLTGEPVESSKSIWNRCLDSDRHEVAVKYVALLGLNDLQTQWVHNVILGHELIVMVQGPPGTGKTTTSSATTTAVAILGLSTLETAPSNGAVMALLSGVYYQRESVIRRFISDQVADSYEIIYFTTWSTVTDSLLNPQPDGRFPKAMLWSHIKRRIERISNKMLELGEKNYDNKLNKINNAKRWLDTFRRVDNGQILSPEEARWYLKHAETEMPGVFRDYKHAGIPMIVLSTCNTSAILRDAKFEFEPALCLIDELAQAFEADAWIPLVLNPIRILLLGDGKQLDPVSLSRGRSEAYGQSLFSMYSRLSKVYHEIQLKINYRFGPRVAIFPSIASYSYLGCGINTMISNPHTEAIEHFMEKSSFGQECTRLRNQKPPQLPAMRHLDFKSSSRLCFDVADGFSSVFPGTHSQTNFAHVNFVVALVVAFFAHQKTHGDANVHRFKTNEVTIITPYKKQKSLLMEHLAMRGFKLNILTEEELRDLQVGTVEVMQGFENVLIIFDIVVANEHNPASLGFVAKWLRMNVGLTRAKTAVWMVCNWTRLWKQLDLMMNAPKSHEGFKNWALLLIDLYEMGDVVTITQSYINRWCPPALPANESEVESGNWSIEQRRMTKEESEFSNHGLINTIRKIWPDGARLRPFPNPSKLGEFSDLLAAKRKEWLENQNKEVERIANLPKEDKARVQYMQQMIDVKIAEESVEALRVEAIEAEKAAAKMNTARPTTERANSLENSTDVDMDDDYWEVPQNWTDEINDAHQKPSAAGAGI